MGDRYKQPAQGTSRRAFLRSGAVGIAATGLAGCLGRGVLDTGDQTKIPQGGVFTIGIPEPPKGVNPLTVSATESFALTELLYGRGTATDPLDFGVHPSVYTAWEVENAGSPNRKPKVVFDVRGGLTFTDGTELTVEDVRFTYEFLLEKTPEKYTPIVEPIESVERSPSRKWDMEMTLTQAVPTFDSEQLQVPILPKHRWKDVEAVESYDPIVEGGPVGLGPGRLRRYEPENGIEVAFREHYALADLDWIREKDALLDGGPFLEGVRYEVYPEEKTLHKAFERGAIDAVYGSVDPAALPGVKGSSGKRFIQGFDTAYRSYLFNLRRVPLDDACFRQVLGFAFDDRYWVEELNDGQVFEGDYVVPPGYTAVRPETKRFPQTVLEQRQGLLGGPSTQAFHFREADRGSGAVDIEGIRSFLRAGRVIDGEPGTFVGREYPGSLTEVTASQIGALHDYSFGPVISAVLENADVDVDRELRVDGEPITGTNGDPLTILAHPPDERPKEAKMLRRYLEALHRIGIPVTTRVLGREAIRERVFRREQFDVATIEANPVSEFALGSLYVRFHSDNADDHSVADVGNTKNTQQFLRNASGYGLTHTATADHFIDEALTTMVVEERNDLIRDAVERIYLDFSAMVTSYERHYWPVDARFGGFLGNVPGPGEAQLPRQLIQIYRKESSD